MSNNKNVYHLLLPMVPVAVQYPSVYYSCQHLYFHRFTFVLIQTWIVDEATSSTTSPISSNASGAIIDLYLFSNTRAVDHFIKQQAIQHAIITKS
jgi:hypothetical protein